MNKVILIGRITKDLELTYTQTNNKAVCKFTLAVDRRFDKEKVDFINCVAWEKLAETIAKYCTKGQKIAVEGRMETRNYEKDGHKVYVTEVTCDSMEFVDSSKKESAPKQEEPEQESVPDDFKRQTQEDFDDDGLPF